MCYKGNWTCSSSLKKVLHSIDVASLVLTVKLIFKVLRMKHRCCVCWKSSSVFQILPWPKDFQCCCVFPSFPVSLLLIFLRFWQRTILGSYRFVGASQMLPLYISSNHWCINLYRSYASYQHPTICVCTFMSWGGWKPAVKTIFHCLHSVWVCDYLPSQQYSSSSR